MNSTVRTILLLVLILVAAVGLYNFVERTQSPARSFNFTELLARVESGDIGEVTIAGSRLTGKLLKDGQDFQSTLPAGAGAIYEKLVAAKVQVTILPTDQPSWPASLLSWLMPLLAAFALGWFCASRSGRIQTPA